MERGPSQLLVLPVGRSARDSQEEPCVRPAGPTLTRTQQRPSGRSEREGDSDKWLENPFLVNLLQHYSPENPHPDPVLMERELVCFLKQPVLLPSPVS